MSFQRIKEISHDLIAAAGKLAFVRESIISQLESPKQNVVILKGARGIGKSTVLQQFLFKRQQENKSVLYVSADNTLLEQTPSELAYDYQKRGGEYLVIDEIHKCSNWQAEAKTIVDSFPKIKLIVSGSSAISLDYSAADLSRRHIMINAKGLSLREYFCKEQQINLPLIELATLTSDYEDLSRVIGEKVAASNIDLLSVFKKYLREGYFISRDNYPTEMLYYDSLINTINSVIDSDLPYTYKEINTVSKQKIKLLLKHIARLCPFTPNISQLAKNLSIGSDNVLKKYLLFLHKGDVLANVYSKNKTHKDFPKPEKIFLDNTNFSYSYAENPLLGTVRETFVANCLRDLGDLTAPAVGDFCLDNELVFEVGGRSKGHRQIKSVKNSFVLADDIMRAEARKIPLWLLGFLW